MPDRRLWLGIALLWLLPCWRAVGQRPGGAPVYRISGVVVTSRDGSPVPFCRLEASASHGAATPSAPGPDRVRARRGRSPGFEPSGEPAAPAHTTVADAHGRFVLAVAGPGAWQVSAVAPGFHRQRYEQHEEFFSSVVLTAALPAKEILFRIAPDASFAGLVLDEAGDPVRGAEVEVEAAAAGTGFQQAPRRVAFGETDDRGHYEMGALAPGIYRVRVQAQPWYAPGGRHLGFGPVNTQRPAGAELDPSLDVIYETVWYPGATDRSGAEEMRLEAGEERQADFHLQPIPATHLRIAAPKQAEGLKEPAAAGGSAVGQRARRTVLLTKVSGEGGFSQLTSGEEVDLGGLSPGVYELRIEGQEGELEGGVRQFRVLAGGSDVVDVGSGTSLTRVTLAVDGAGAEDAGEVTFLDADTGRSVPENGPPQGFARRFHPPDGAAGRSASGERSVFVSPGTYQVIMASSGMSYVTGLTATGAQVTGLTVRIGAVPAVARVHTASRRGQISGVAGAAGVPVQAAMVLLVPATLGQPGATASIERDQSNSDGSFRFSDVVPGRYILLALEDGWRVNWRDAGTLAAYLVHGTALELAPGGEVRMDVDAQKP